MAYTVSALHVKGFEKQIRHLAQQTDTRLRPWVQERTEVGSSRNWPRVAAAEFRTKPGRGAASPVTTIIQDSQYTNRVTTVATYDDGDLVEQDELEQVLVDPMSAVAQRLAFGARRQYDRIIIAAATGAALDENGATPAFPAGQTVGDYGGEFDFAMITAVNALFLKNNIPPEEPKCFVIGPNQARALLHEARATNSLFTGGAVALQDGGYVKNWMGFTWIVSNLLTAPAPGTLQCFAMTRKALGLQVAKDIWVDVMKDPSASMAWRIYSAFTAGAVRVEDEHIVQCQVKDTVTAV